MTHVQKGIFFSDKETVYLKKKKEKETVYLTLQSFCATNA